MAYLPRSSKAGFKAREIPLGKVKHNKKNAFGARSFWSFFPGTYGAIDPGASTNVGKSFLSVGQPLIASFLEDSGSVVRASVSPYSGDSLGYCGLAANLFDQASNGGWEYDFGSGGDGRIQWPNKQSLTMWALFKPIGDGSIAQSGDPRVLSRDNGTGTANHYYMIGGVRSGGAVRARMRFKINGTTQTIVVTSQNWQNDALNFMAATYDGSNLTLHHIREDGGYGTASASSSGDITDSTSGSVGLALGGNFVASNSYEGEILGAGAFDYAENDQNRLLLFRNNISQILKPANNKYYFVPAVTALTVNVGISSETDTALSITPQTDLTVDVGISLETDSALSVTPVSSLTVSVGLSSETDTALSVSPEVDLSVDVGISIEADAALSITPVSGLSVAVGITSETDTALIVSPISEITVNVGIASESDSALSASPVTSITVDVGISSEADTAQSVTPISGLSVSVGIAIETDSALSVSIDLDLFFDVGISEETDIALNVTAQVSGGVVSCLSGYVTIEPLLSGDTTIKPVLSGYVNLG